MESTRILGTGSYLPPTVLTNYDLEKEGLDTTHDWIVKRTGVSERRIADKDMTTSDLGCRAALKALEMAGMAARQIDLIIVATITPDTCCPSAANWLQAKLDAPRAITFDVTAACSGFIFALNVAEQYLQNKTCKTVLVVAAEVMSRTLNWNDRTTCILWGDGAGAALLTLGSTGHELLSTHLHTDGANGQDLLLPGGGSKTTPISHQSVDQGLHFLNMIEANLSFRVAVRGFTAGIREAVVGQRANTVAISPIVGGDAIKGPAADLMRTLGHEVSAVGVADLYADVAAHLVIDEIDGELGAAVAATGVHAHVTDTMMRSVEVAAALAKKQNYLGIGGSDAHIVSHIGRCATEFPADIHNEQELVEALQGSDFTAIKVPQEA